MAELGDFHQRAAVITGHPLRPRQREQFNKYLELLRQWGSVHRFIGSTKPSWIVENLFLDSLLFLQLLPDSVGSVMDLGAGAGVPGIPIKIVRPDIGLTLLESKQRKVSFLSTVVRELGLAGVVIVNARAEHAPAELKQSFDAVVTRCAGNLATVLPLALRFAAAPGGLVIASGPPKPRPLTGAEWITVPGARDGTTRAFVRIKH